MAMWLEDPLLPDEIDGYEVTYRTDRGKLEEQARFYWVVREMWENINNNGWWWLIQFVFIPAILGNSWVVLQFYGMSNSGKSWLAVAKAFLLKELLEAAGFDDVQIFFTRNWSETLKLLENYGSQERDENGRRIYAQKGDIVICDEETDLSGEESETEREAMSNVLRSCRILGFNLFFSDPAPKPKDNIDAYIRVAGLIKDIFTTMSIMYGAEESLIGLDFTKVPVNDPLFDEMMPDYEKEKVEYALGLVKARGRLRAHLTELQEEQAQRLMNFALDMETKGHKISRKNLDLWVDRVDPKISGSTKHVEKVITWALEMLKDQKGGVPIGSGMHKNFDVPLVFKRERRDKDIPEGFNDRLVEHLTKYEESWEDKCNPRNFEALLLWLKGKSQAEVGRQLGVGQSSVSTYIDDALAHINSRYFGYAVEDVVAEYHPDWKHAGLASNDPDFIDEENRVVYSVKGLIRREGFRTPYPDWLAREEVRLLLEEGYQLYILMYECKHKMKVRRVAVVPDAEMEEEIFQ